MTHFWIFIVQFSLLLVKMPPLPGMYDVTGFLTWPLNVQAYMILDVESCFLL
jgi:hypothetical protein